MDLSADRRSHWNRLLSPAFRVFYLAFLLITYLGYDLSNHPERYRGFIPPFDIVEYLFYIVTALLLCHWLPNADRVRFARTGVLVLLFFVATWFISIGTFGSIEVPHGLRSIRPAPRDEQGYVAYARHALIALKFTVGYIVVPWLAARLVSLSQVLLVLLAAAAVHMAAGIHQLGYFYGLWPPGAFPIQVGWWVDGRFFYYFGRATGLSDNPFVYGVLLMLAFLMASALYASTRRRRYLVLAAVLFAASLLSGNKSLLVGYAAVFGLHALSSRNRLELATAIVPALAAVAFLVFSLYDVASIKAIDIRLERLEVSNSVRILNQSAALVGFTQSPLLGYGIGHDVVTDSTYLAVLLEGGVLYLVGYLTLWISFLISTVRMRRKAGAPSLEYYVAHGLMLFLGAFFMMSFVIGTVERMPIILAFTSVYFALYRRMELLTNGVDRRTMAPPTPGVATH